ncbi:(-)-germacrene D synthase-like isoform X2 [Vigna unguiculata]|uniref:(-)-germacrene D synthase-like isoform X2 n=1 Tax=Vigna unguiculata TaxID=3917 RepID=UPI001015D669|nr:(-)-germacrene D synthase-like isoform X2 [Vigna unguiculata]
MSTVSSSIPVFPYDAKPNSNVPRHTATFHPSIWGDYFLSYDSSFHEDDSDMKQVPVLKEYVREMIVSPVDVFCQLKDKAGNFKESILNDVQGMLSLYDASQLRFHGEDILEETYSFTLTELTKSLTTKLSPFLSGLVHRSIGQALRKGMPRLEARYYISFYQQDPSHNQRLLTFAKLDFNTLQKLHQKEVRNVTKWWVKDLNVSANFPFVRDRIVEICFWIIGVYYEPQYYLARRILTKLTAMLSIIDDVYDAYGTIDELEIFTNAIERWDISSLVDLPEYMKLCYKALLDIFEETEQELKKQGKEYFVKYSKSEMKRLAQAYLSESRWFHSNHTPTVEEYMEVATITSTYSLLTTVSFLGMEDTTEEVLIWVTSHPKIIEAASVISRLMDDIVGTEFEHERGHVVSSVDCYMKQYNSSRQNALKELHKLVESAWKDINKECLNPTQVPMMFLIRVLNLARVMDVLYKEQDNYTNSGGVTKDYIKALLVNKVSTQ